MSQGQVDKMTMSARFNLWVVRAACIWGAAKKKKERKEEIMVSHVRISSEPPVYIWLLYKLINVINRPGRIAWESVFCTETVSILNEREGERKRERKGKEEREREISSFFPSVLFFSSSSSAHSVLCSAECVERVGCSTISTNQTEQQRYRFLLCLSKSSWLNRNWTCV